MSAGEKAPGAPVLVRPCNLVAHRRQLYAAVAEFRAAGEPVAPYGLTFGARSFARILELTRDHELGHDIPAPFTPSTTWWLVDHGGRLLGAVNIRHYLNDYLEQYIGHIGYGVRPAERRKGYAGRMLSLALEKCREMGMDRVLLCCFPENTASVRTILGAGGVLEDERVWENRTVQRYWISLSSGTESAKHRKAPPG